MHAKQYRELLDEVCADYCSPDHYCILKEFLVHSNPSPRVLMQMKCIEKFKYERSALKQQEIVWEEAMRQWVDEGHATKFAGVYKDGMGFSELYKAIIGS